MCFRCYGNLKFSLTCNSKNENCDLIADIFGGKKSEMFIERFSTKHNFCPNPTILLVVMATEMLNLRKIFRGHKGDKAETLQ